MGHTKPQDLTDLKDILDQIRSWENIRETSPNIFYIRSTPFLHFHDKDGKRWADVKDSKTWGKPIEIPFNPTKAQQKKFLTEVQKRFQKQKK